MCVACSISGNVAGGMFEGVSGVYQLSKSSPAVSLKNKVATAYITSIRSKAQLRDNVCQHSSFLGHCCLEKVEGVRQMRTRSPGVRTSLRT